MAVIAVKISAGAGNTGLTLSGQWKNSAGTNVGSAVTTGFIELGNGDYVVDSTPPTNGIFFVVSNSVGPVYLITGAVTNLGIVVSLGSANPSIATLSGQWYDISTGSKVAVGSAIVSYLTFGNGDYGFATSMPSGIASLAAAFVVTNTSGSVYEACGVFDLSSYPLVSQVENNIVFAGNLTGTLPENALVGGTGGFDLTQLSLRLRR